MEEINDGRTTWLMAAFVLVNTALGAGLLNYPVAYDRLGGIAFASVIQICAVFLMATTMLVLVYCARLHNVHSYHEVLRIMCGKRVMQVAAASIAITCFGICVTYLIIIGDQFDRLLATYIGPAFCTRWYAHRNFTMAVTAVAAIWPMCYFRRLDFLRHVNLLGVFASFYVIFLNIYKYYDIRAAEPTPPPMRTVPASAVEFIAALPIAFFAYQTHEVVIPVHVSMSDQSLGAFSKATAVALTILLVLYSLSGTFGYLTFGSKVAPDIMLNYEATDVLVVAGVCALIVKMITTYPPILFGGRDTIIRLLLARDRTARGLKAAAAAKDTYSYQSIEGSDGSGGSPTSSSSSSRSSTPTTTPSFSFASRSKLYHILITTVWNVVVLLLAIVTPNITVAIGFLGSLASCNVFVYPGMALITLAAQHYHQSKQKSYYYADEEEELFCEQDSKVSLKASKTLGLQSKGTCGSSLLSRFSLSRRPVQIFLMLYGVFIVLMGSLMFVIILIQVYRDVQNPIPHGAVCDESL